MQIASSKIRTRVAVFISYDDNHGHFLHLFINLFTFKIFILFIFILFIFILFIFLFLFLVNWFIFLVNDFFFFHFLRPSSIQWCWIYSTCVNWCPLTIRIQIQIQFVFCFAFVLYIYIYFFSFFNC